MSVYFCTKPYGWPTHKVDTDKIGFVEFRSEQINEKLNVCHRLDKTTSGAMVFAKNKETAQELETLFRDQKVKKTYYFVTDRNVDFQEKVHTSYISEENKIWSSDTKKSYNAETKFTLVKLDSGFSLWKAEPKSGKTHQIRLHAKDIGIPILGDAIYGGSKYPFILLHSYQLVLPERMDFTSPLPPYMETLSVLKNQDLSSAILAIKSRQDLFLQRPDCMRWIHKEVPWLCVDQLGDHIWYQIFDTKNPSPELISWIQKTIEGINDKQLSSHIQIMPNRGESPNKKLVEDHGNTTWLAKEHGITYEFRSTSGSSYGLFLDQRQNRKWMIENAKNKRVLNLFCYTGGFSLCALAAGATEVVSVDTSKATLEWLNENAKHNAFTGKHETWSTDARIFLKGSKQRNRLFDIIVCDPPSFSRGKEGTFRIENDLGDLLRACLQILAKKGTLLFSTNYEGWTIKEFQDRIREEVPKGYTIERFTSSDVDYEAPNSERILKGVFIFAP